MGGGGPSIQGPIPHIIIPIIMQHPYSYIIHHSIYDLSILTSNLLSPLQPFILHNPFDLFMATLDCKKINTCLFSPCADPHTHSLHQLCGEEDHSPSTIELTNKQHSFQIKPNCHLRLKSRPSHFHQQFNTATQIGSCDSSTFTFTSSIRHKLDSSENTSSSAHSKTTGNCRDSESQYSENDQSGNANASARPSIKRKRVHKLSERRRDRINKRLRALRNLIPNCTKMDKADVLDEAIEYLKSLQLQLQIMPFCAGLCVPPTRVILPTQYPIIGAGAGCSALQLFGLPFAGYGTRLQMPMNALPVESPRRSAIKDAQSLRWF